MAAFCRGQQDPGCWAGSPVSATGHFFVGKATYQWRHTPLVPGDNDVNDFGQPVTWHKQLSPEYER